MEFIFNDKQSMSLRVLNSEKTRWAFNKKIDSSGFYQLKMDGKLSELYKLEMIKDQPAVIRIISPAQYSSIDIGQPKKTLLNVQINDDYGIEDAFISATISRGKGEGVQFKDQKISLAASFGGDRQYQFKKTLDLEALGMAPGDELYFFINAKDSRRQESRSDVYIVTIQDTAQLMSMDGMLSGVNLVPEYFRSQRQIIIDTEKLIKERSKSVKQSLRTAAITWALTKNSCVCVMVNFLAKKQMKRLERNMKIMLRMKPLILEMPKKCWMAMPINMISLKMPPSLSLNLKHSSKPLWRKCGVLNYD
jgi:hypothetical protein